MYPPPHYQDDDLQKMLKVVEVFPFATLITSQNTTPFITHIPLIFNKKRNTLVGHIDKNNPQVATLVNNTIATAIFHGPDAYISPSKMATKQLPTWNYIKVHVKGEIQVIPEAENMMKTLIQMTAFLEGKDQNYVLSKDNDSMHRLVKYIHCFEIANLTWEGKFKASQDKNETDQALAKKIIIENSQDKIKQYFKNSEFSI